MTRMTARAIPQLGLGLADSRRQKCEERCSRFRSGLPPYRTASFYGNEESVGAAVRASGIRREEIFVTTKLWNSDHGSPERALETSLRKLKLDYVDLYLIHYPVPERPQSWRALERLRQQGKTRSIGVSNFTVRHLPSYCRDGDVPAVNQVEFTPTRISESYGFLRVRGIVVEAYCPWDPGTEAE